MKTEIILLIIGFQVVMGIMAKRKAKKAAEAAEALKKARNATMPPGGPGTSAPSATVERKPQAVIPGRTSYDEDDADNEEEWEEHHLRGESRNARPADIRAVQKPGAPEPARPSAGKDLLSHLAKELGLEIPGLPGRSEPAPRPRPPQHAAKPAVQTQASRTQTARPTARKTAIDQRAETSRRTHTERPTYRDGGENAPRRIPSSLPVTQEPQGRSAASLAQESLGDGESIRRAFILKTILDKPLSLQPRRPGEN